MLFTRRHDSSAELIWRRLARRARFDGVLLVFGYGVGGRPGDEQRKAERTGELSGTVLADYEPGVIRVWVPCTCQAAEFDAKRLNEVEMEFAHFLRQQFDVQTMAAVGFPQGDAAERIHSYLTARTAGVQLGTALAVAAE